MKNMNCISCNENMDISVKYTAANTNVSWRKKDSKEKIFSLLNDIVIWPIPLCKKCAIEVYIKELKKKNKDALRFIGFCLAFGIFFLLIKEGEISESLLANIFFLVMIYFMFILAISGLIIILINVFKIIMVHNSNVIPKKDENISFISIANDILNSFNEKYTEYLKPKYLNLDEMVLNEKIERQITEWRNSQGKFFEEKKQAVYKYASLSEEGIIKYLQDKGEINKLPDPKKWLEKRKNDAKYEWENQPKFPISAE